MLVANGEQLTLHFRNKPQAESRLSSGLDQGVVRRNTG